MDWSRKEKTQVSSQKMGTRPSRLHKKEKGGSRVKRFKRRIKLAAKGEVMVVGTLWK